MHIILKCKLHFSNTEIADNAEFDISIVQTLTKAIMLTITKYRS